MRTYLILHNIRSTYNVGAIFRTADGAGVEKIYLTGYTPAPVDRFGRTDEGMRKTALGATESVPYEATEGIQNVITRLKKDNVEVIAVEQTDDALDYRDLTRASDVAFILGNEVTGIEPEVLSLASKKIAIPMRGTKESLNVAVAAGIVLYRHAL